MFLKEFMVKSFQNFVIVLTLENFGNCKEIKTIAMGVMRIVDIVVRLILEFLEASYLMLKIKLTLVKI
jgi:hypothetical protein